jgi:dolichol-phosphate mannosyltransferase
VRDVNSGLKAMTREVADELPLHGELHRFLPVFAAARGFRVAEVDVAHEPRRHGRSRYGWSRYVAGFLDSATVLLLTRYGTRPLHFFGCFGLLVAVVGAGALAYLAVGWLFGQWIGNRPLLVFGALCVLLGIQCVFFGLLAELVVVAGRRRDAAPVREVIRGKRGA